MKIYKVFLKNNHPLRSFFFFHILGYHKIKEPYAPVLEVFWPSEKKGPEDFTRGNCL